LKNAEYISVFADHLLADTAAVKRAEFGGGSRMRTVQNNVTLVVTRRLFRREKARLHVTCRVKYLRLHITRLYEGDDETPRRRVRHLAACWTRQRRPVDIVNSDTRVPVPSAAPRRAAFATTTHAGGVN